MSLVIHIFIYRYKQQGSNEASYNKHPVYPGKTGSKLAVNKAEQDTAEYQYGGQQNKKQILSF